MKKLILIFALSTIVFGVKAQVAYDIKAPETGKMGEFTEWKKVNVVFDDDSKAEIEYRLALVTRKGIACHYDFEVKNTSNSKLNVRVKSSYYDKLVKNYFGDEIKETLKPGKGFNGRFVGQGCKKEKGVEKDDYGHCIACGLTFSIFVSK